MFDKKIILVILGFIATILFSLGMATNVQENYNLIGTGTGLGQGFTSVSMPVVVSCKTGKEYPLETSFKNMSKYGPLVKADGVDSYPTVSNPGYQEQPYDMKKFLSTGLPAETKMRAAPLSMQGQNTASIPLQSSRSGPVLLKNLTSIESFSAPNKRTVEFYDQGVTVENMEDLKKKNKPLEIDYQNMVQKMKMQSEQDSGAIIPPKCMDVLLDDGSTDQVYISNRNMYANKRSRLNASGVVDRIRGDLAVAPSLNNNWFNPLGAFNPGNSVTVGALAQMGGAYNSQTADIQALKSMYSNANGLYGGIPVSKPVEEALYAKQGLALNDNKPNNMVTQSAMMMNSQSDDVMYSRVPSSIQSSMMDIS
jgi:hypothetical protein